ncbi:MAG: MaoC family dehydratase N-terminal domain-containing protein, partial [Pseudomonadota bacterium]
MAIDYQKVMALKQTGKEFSYRDRETMLYALGIGMGSDPMNQDELPFVYENGLKAMPTLATVVAWGSGNVGASGINYAMVVHGEQRLKMHKPMPTEASITSDSHFVEVLDKGAGK